MHSLYEIETVVKRVARYQGLSWGIAEEAGKAVRALEQSALPGLERFDRLINFPYKKCAREINHKEKKEVEIAYLGILEEYQNKKLGSHLLSEAIKISFKNKIDRVWVHTCTLDHKNALKNYITRGMKIFKTEVIKI